jgi:hypothetical protein
VRRALLLLLLLAAGCWLLAAGCWLLAGWLLAGLAIAFAFRFLRFHTPAYTKCLIHK